MEAPSSRASGSASLACREPRSYTPGIVQTADGDPALPPRHRWAAWLVFVAALAWLSIGAGRRALWQDEASTALLGERLLETGRPLAFDGTNLLTMDDFRAEEEAEIGAAMKSTSSALSYLTARGDFAADTTWTGQPWGSFALAGLSETIAGKSELALRLPFIACAAAAAALLWWVLASRTGTASGWLGVAVLLTNVFWFVHSRQCRYYAPSSLWALATFAAYLRWRDDRRFGAALFVLAAVVWFQFDFGSPFPVLAVLALDALAFERRRLPETLGVFALVSLLYLPSILYFDLADRLRPTDLPLPLRAAGLAFYVNQYVLPFAVGAAALGLFSFSRRASPNARRIVALALAIIFGELAWMSYASPYPFLRYVIGLAPFGAMVVALVAVEIGRRLGAEPRAAAAIAAGVCALQIASPVFAAPLSRMLSRDLGQQLEPGPFVRAELDVLWSELAREAPDPNRAVVDALRARLEPGDEVLANYENLPLAFYLDVPVRGGIAGFRVEDAEPARFVVLRRTVDFVHWPPYERALAKARYRRLPIDAPDVPWGNNPDPLAHWSRIPSPAPSLILLERDDPARR